mmetsp:Transcript_43314/g.38549  ORF Transcript_43314/g.38549 Transcript_43314/m.38549 type:complete len:475 (-) Transcript_43314:14-1438(-)
MASKQADGSTRIKTNDANRNDCHPNNCGYFCRKNDKEFPTPPWQQYSESKFNGNQSLPVYTQLQRQHVPFSQDTLLIDDISPFGSDGSMESNHVYHKQLTQTKLLEIPAMGELMDNKGVEPFDKSSDCSIITNNDTLSLLQQYSESKLNDDQSLSICTQPRKSAVTFSQHTMLIRALSAIANKHDCELRHVIKCFNQSIGKEEFLKSLKKYRVSKGTAFKIYEDLDKLGLVSEIAGQLEHAKIPIAEIRFRHKNVLKQQIGSQQNRIAGAENTNKRVSNNVNTHEINNNEIQSIQLYVADPSPQAQLYNNETETNYVDERLSPTSNWPHHVNQSKKKYLPNASFVDAYEKMENENQSIQPIGAKENIYNDLKFTQASPTFNDQAMMYYCLNYTTMQIHSHVRSDDNDEDEEDDYKQNNDLQQIHQLEQHQVDITQPFDVVVELTRITPDIRDMILSTQFDLDPGFYTYVPTDNN